MRTFNETLEINLEDTKMLEGLRLRQALRYVYVTCMCVCNIIHIHMYM